MIRNSIEVWILVDDRILLVHVLREKGDFWQPITGGIEAGESAENEWKTVAVDDVLPELRWNHDTRAMVRPLVGAALA